MLIDFILVGIIVLPTLLTLFTTRATLGARIGWATLTLMPFVIAWLVVWWRSSAAPPGQEMGAAMDSLTDIGFLAFMLLGSWFVYFKFRGEHKSDA